MDRLSKSLAALFWFIGGYALAAETVPLPAMRIADDVSYLSAGIGEDDREALKIAGAGFNLKVVTALKSGEYLADVKVTISAAKGKKVLETVAEGPWLLVKLKPGTYDIETETMGEALRQRVMVKNKGQRVVYFYWSEEKP
jgi:hypothetical protein